MFREKLFHLCLNNQVLSLRHTASLFRIVCPASSSRIVPCPGSVKIRIVLQKEAFSRRCLKVHWATPHGLALGAVASPKPLDPSFGRKCRTELAVTQYLGVDGTCKNFGLQGTEHERYLRIDNPSFSHAWHYILDVLDAAANIVELPQQSLILSRLADHRLATMDKRGCNFSPPGLLRPLPRPCTALTRNSWFQNRLDRSNEGMEAFIELISFLRSTNPDVESFP